MKLLLVLSGLCAVIAMLTGSCSEESVIFAKNTSANSILISKSGSGQGMIRVESFDKFCGIDCKGPMAFSVEEGSIIRLIAQPSTESEFEGWYGACRGRSSTCIVIVGSNSQITARFLSR